MIKPNKTDVFSQTKKSARRVMKFKDSVVEIQKEQNLLQGTIAYKQLVLQNVLIYLLEYLKPYSNNQCTLNSWFKKVTAAWTFSSNF
jgi:hypothetical protein